MTLNVLVKLILSGSWVHIHLLRWKTKHPHCVTLVEGERHIK